VAVRIYSLAKDIGLDSKELVDLCTRLGILNKGSALASLDDDEITKIKKHLAEKAAPAAVAQPVPAPQDSGLAEPRETLPHPRERVRSKPNGTKPSHWRNRPRLLLSQ